MNETLVQVENGTRQRYICAKSSNYNANRQRETTAHVRGVANHPHCQLIAIKTNEILLAN